ncbi:Uncharacterised protein [Escherichia coli]|nr:Uncharacterised protein [Escherichia coli]CAD5879891.1 Uncharacterised protein [Escherichia coli]
MGGWRFYFCEPGVMTVDDLSAGWGLLDTWLARKSSVGSYGCETVQGEQTG